MQKVIREAIEASGAYAPPVSGVATLASPAARATLRSDAGVVSGPSGASVPTWTRDRDACAAEAARLRTVVQELQGRYAATKKRTLEANAAALGAQSERASLEQWFHRRAGTRTAAVEEARNDVRLNLVAIARRAIGDGAAFGAEFDPARDRLAKLDRAAESAARDVMVHEAALAVHDPRALQTGLVVGAVAALVALALLVAPIAWRATRVVEPPLHHTSAPSTR
jgi:hypothetical protein